jgi:hypothetical protein
METMTKDLIDSMMDGVIWAMKKSQTNWLKEKDFKKGLRNKALGDRLGISSAPCCICPKRVVTSLSMAIPAKYHKYFGEGIYLGEMSKDGKYPIPSLQACKGKCYNDNFEMIKPVHEDNNQYKKIIEHGYTIGKNPKAQAIIDGNKKRLGLIPP